MTIVSRNSSFKSLQAFRRRLSTAASPSPKIRAVPFGLDPAQAAKNLKIAALLSTGACVSVCLDQHSYQCNGDISGRG